MRKCQGHTIDSSEISIGHYRCYCILHDIDMTFTLTWLLGEISLFVCQSSLSLGLREKCHIIITNLHQTGGLLGIYFYVSFMSVFDVYGIYFVKAKSLASTLGSISTKLCKILLWIFWFSCCHRLPGPTSRMSTAGSESSPRGSISSAGNRRSQVFSDKAKPAAAQAKGKHNFWTKHHIVADNMRPIFH